MTLELRVVSSNPTLGIEPTLKKEKKRFVAFSGVISPA